MFTIPTDISGCFLWLKAHDIGTVNNGPVCYWQDASGSGNYMNVNTAATSSTACPKYIINGLNGYSTVRFNGSANWLSSTGNYNAGTDSYYFSNLQVSGLTSFTVYKGNNTNSTMVLLCNDIAGINTFSTSVNFLISTDIAPNLSGWSWLWKNLGTNSHTISSSGVLVASGEWTLRTDRWRSTDGTFYFSKNGADISSGSVVGMATNTKNSFKLGATTRTGSAGSFLDGEIAEIVEYSRMLNDIETDWVEDYLRQKYNLNGTSSFPLFLYGENDPTGLMYSDFTLFVSGLSSSNNNMPLFISASTLISSGMGLYELGGRENNNIPLYTIGNTGLTGNFKLYIAAASNWSSGLPLYMFGTGVANHFPLYTAAASSINLSTTIYMTGSQGSEFRGMTLYMNPATLINSGMSLYMNPATTFFNLFSLYTNAANIGSSGMSLFLPGSTDYSMFPLYIYGFDTFTSGFPLFTSAATGINSLTNLYIAGLVSHSGYMPLFLKQLPTPQLSGRISLYTFAPDNAGSSGIQSNFPLYMYCDGVHAGMPLFLPNFDSNEVPFASMPLFITGPVTSGTSYNFSPLYVFNAFAESGRFLKLTIAGEGQMDGASVGEANMNLFLKASPGNYAALPLFMSTFSSQNLSTNLFMFGVNTISNSIPMYMAGTGTLGNIPLFISGPPVSNSGFSMYVKGYPFIGQSITQYVHGF